MVSLFLVRKGRLFWRINEFISFKDVKRVDFDMYRALVANLIMDIA